MIYVLWDASDIWGPLAVWGIRGLGAPCRIVRAQEIANGLLQRETPSILLAPGGFGRHKFMALGTAGQESIRAFLRQGGSYIGFCGGAGLALSGEHSLGICPWQRAGYAHRMQHYISGHFHVTPDGGKIPWPQNKSAQGESGMHLTPKASLPLLPVWWPGRFAPERNSQIAVLAAYESPGPDFWMADLQIASLPQGVFDDWEKKYGFSPSAEYLRGEPCAIYGEYGKGHYILTYSHLETPQSETANAWLALMFATFSSFKPQQTTIPSWDLTSVAPLWEEPAIKGLWLKLHAIMETGLDSGLFFMRSPWLSGWRTGIPGAVLNTLRAQLHVILSHQPSNEATSFWNAHKEDFVPAFTHFAKCAENYLLAERVTQALAKELPDTVSPEKLFTERTAVFGSSGMAGHAGGLLGPLLPVLDELAYRQLSNAH